VNPAFGTNILAKAERTGKNDMKDKNMELKVTDIIYELDNEDGLSYLLFKYAGGYFSNGLHEQNI